MKLLPIAGSALAFVFAALMISTAWAGSMGNGHPQSGPAFLFCYGGLAKVEYFSNVFAPAPGSKGGSGEWQRYLDRMGYRNDGGQCRGAPTQASAVAAKEQAEEIFRSAEYHREIVETGWSGA